MAQSTNHRSGARRAAAGVVALGVAAACALAGSASAPASSEASRLVTITFNDSGKGRWSTSGDTDRGSMAMNYSWKGTAKFRVPTTALKNPSKAKFSVRGTGSLSGSWLGDFAGTQFGTASAGPYHCTYKGALVKTTVDAQLKNGPKKGRLQIILFARSYETGIYFFPTKGAGVTQDCANPTGAGGPAHFSPRRALQGLVQRRRTIDDADCDHRRPVDATAARQREGHVPEGDRQRQLAAAREDRVAQRRHALPQGTLS